MIKNKIRTKVRTKNFIFLLKKTNIYNNFYYVILLFYF